MRQRAVTGFGIMLFFILVFAIFFYASFTTVVVKGQSMEDTFHSGDRLLASKAYWLIGGVRKGDIVVVHLDDEKDYVIKRVCFMPGEVVDFQNVPDDWSLAKGEYHVPEGRVFVLGDNYYVSEDSRKFGPIRFDHILGKVVVLPRSWVARIGMIIVIVCVLLGVSFGISHLMSRKRSPAA